VIRGQVYYGWAPIERDLQERRIQQLSDRLRYETIPNKAITTGKTKGTEEEGAEQLSPTSLAAPIREPANLGLLALGSPGLSIWRREERNREEGELR
jgi:hypothetical protein